MRWSRSYIPTLKEAPADAEVISHQLMTRAGMIRKLAAGIYNYLPLGLRAIAKVSNIVREEMNRAGSQEVLLPAVQPGDLWVESGRWELYGKELLRFTDRHDRHYCLGPTHEEVMTDLVRGEVRSYRQLPLSLYQIQTKFRDEIRPRFGLMRGREFIMKDGYSFDKDDQGADISYRAMYDAYNRIFSRLALKFRPVEADSGSIGGSFSHEFMVLAQTGEDTVVSCTGCDYAANLERAVAKVAYTPSSVDCPPCAEVFTPAQHSVEEISAFLQVPAFHIVKTILLDVDGKPVAALVRGDRELNEIKVKNHLNADEVHLATPEQVQQWTKAPVGFAGPVALEVPTILADLELEQREGWVAGANKADSHLTNVSLRRDAKITAYVDLRTVAEGDTCVRCGAMLGTARGIEVGHVFKLGTKYSKAMKAVFLDETGAEKDMIMGCYGIGVTRVVASCIEQNHDDKGIVFPPPMAPMEVVLLCLDPANEAVFGPAEEMYRQIQELGLDILLDDREERPGVKFNDADLIGAPMQLVVGAKGLARGVVEAKNRKTGEKVELPAQGFMEAFVTWKNSVYASWGM
ncbi:proline--tRNA ligase [Desulfovibrio cuneatus]|uniref:proline--tRNA ligase n=1 Tax=Desulfovibrio cuneatus TaxID=159728 RepID=UPI00041A2C1A|nr:proline--tRNA ligase [Desulfovibrio cuneatus]